MKHHSKPKISLDQAIRKLAEPSKRITPSESINEKAKRRSVAKAAKASRRRNR